MGASDLAVQWAAFSAVLAGGSGYGAAGWPLSQAAARNLTIMRLPHTRIAGAACNIPFHDATQDSGFAAATTRRLESGMGQSMKVFRGCTFKADRPWGSADIANMGGIGHVDSCGMQRLNFAPGGRSPSRPTAGALASGHPASRKQPPPLGGTS